MKLLRFAVACAAIAGLTTAQDEQNRIDLHNGGDTLWFLQDPFQAGDPANGDYDADMYYKVFPGAALQRCVAGGATGGAPGFSNLVAHQYVVFDDDWTNDSTIPYMEYDLGSANALGEIQSDPYNPSANQIILPAVEGTGFPVPSTCPSPGFVFGYDVRETFLDSTGAQEALPILTATTANNWVYASYFVGANSTSSGSISVPATNGCGNSGDAVFSWLGTIDEAQVDYLATGTSAYGGFQAGTGLSSGVNAYTPEGLTGGAETSIHFAGATVQINADINTGTPSGAHPGLGSLNPYVGLTGGSPAGGGPQIGFLHNDGRAHSVSGDGSISPAPLSGAVGLTNLGATFQDQTGACIPLAATATLALNPGDPIFTVATLLWGIPTFVDSSFGTDPDLDEAIATSGLVPVTPGVGLVGASIKVQTHSIDFAAGNDLSGSSQTWRFVFRDIP